MSYFCLTFFNIIDPLVKFQNAMSCDDSNLSLCLKQMC
jgi:hypothetical protein